MNTFLRISLSVTVFAVTLTGWTGSARAATTNSSMPVSANVPATCSITASPLAFGTYSSVQTDTTTTLSVSCTNTTTYSVGLDAGGGSGATVAARKMSNGTQTLTYSVYSDTSRALVWGTTIGTNTVAGTGTGGAQNINVYGRIPAGQLPTPGSYADTITATITY